jgi:hypothetical protein
MYVFNLFIVLNVEEDGLLYRICIGAVRWNKRFVTCFKLQMFS